MGGGSNTWGHRTWGSVPGKGREHGTGLPSPCRYLPPGVASCHLHPPHFPVTSPTLSMGSAPPVLPFPHHPMTPTRNHRPDHLGPAPLQGPLQFAKEQYSAGGPQGALADRACRESRGIRVDGAILCPQNRPTTLWPKGTPLPGCPSESTLSSVSVSLTHTPLLVPPSSSPGLWLVLLKAL